MIKQTVYIETDPEKESGTWHKDQGGADKYLQKKEDVYVLSKEELFKICKKVWNDAIDYRALVEKEKGCVSKLPVVTLEYILNGVSDTKTR